MFMSTYQKTETHFLESLFAFSFPWHIVFPRSRVLHTIRHGTTITSTSCGKESEQSQPICPLWTFPQPQSGYLSFSKAAFANQ